MTQTMTQKTDKTFRAQNSLLFLSASHKNKIILFFLSLFVVSLPFNAIEWNLISVNRFEFKITMITFPLLFIAWLLSSINGFNFQRRHFKEKIFLTFAMFYGLSQFTSLINSLYPLESIQQGIIISSLLIMMIIVFDSILDEKIAKSILTIMGILSLFIGIGMTISYFFLNSSLSRLGQSEVLLLGIIKLGGDPYYFGDILLYSIGAVFFVAFNLYKLKYWKFLIFPLLFLWFLAIALTYAKGLFLSVMFFFICAICIVKGKRLFLFFCMVLFSLSVVMVALDISGEILRRILSVKEKIINLQQDNIGVNKKTSQQQNNIVVKKRHNPQKNRLNLANPLGINSIYIRIKAMKISFYNSMKRLWFGYGAGLSQKLLPEMANNYDRAADSEEVKKMIKKGVYGEGPNTGLLESHVLFLTEFFNVGLVGAISLMSLTFFVIVEQIKTIKTSLKKKNYMNELLFATLISMLVLRNGGVSLIVIPFLWFIFGLSFGVCKLHWKTLPVK